MKAFRCKSILIAAALAAAVCTSPAQAQDKVKMGLFIASSAMPYFIAVDRGYFKAENLEVEGIPLATHPLIVQAQTKLLKRSEHVIVMADSSKLRRKSAMIVAGLDRINTIVTDDGAKPEELEDFRAAGIKVIVAKVTEEDELKKLA